MKKLVLLFLLSIKSTNADNLFKANDNRRATAFTPQALDQLSVDEIEKTVNIINAISPTTKWLYSWITLQEPLKADLLPYFLEGKSLLDANILRRSFTIVTHPDTEEVFEIVIDMHTEEVISWARAPLGVKAMAAFNLSTPVALITLSDSTVQERLASLGITDIENVVPTPQFYGYDGDKPQYQGNLIAQVLFYKRAFETDNYFAHPLGFLAVVDINSQTVVGLEDLPIQDHSFSVRNRTKDGIPYQSKNYDPSLFPSTFFRTDVHPINILQPNGPSFQIEGNQVRWQKFKFIVGFNGREGIVLHHVTYNYKEKVRPLIYRASISELFIPYGDPRPPFHRQMGFDAGQYGVGQYANNLKEGVDCKGGAVSFLPVIVNNFDGSSTLIPNGICIYEEDIGVLWRKKDAVTGRTVSTRSQRLVISFISTLSNYDYQFNWYLYQDATIQLEVKLTGTVQAFFAANLTQGESPNIHDTKVSDNVNAPVHQHFFVARIDAEIDGNKNNVAILDIVPDSAPSGSRGNPYGNGFHVRRKHLKTPWEARSHLSRVTGRTWEITGNSKEYDYINKITRTPKSWKLVPTANGPPLMIQKISPLHSKCAFTDFDIWVTPYAENQIFPGGLYLNNSGLPEWVNDNPNASLINADVVIWHVFGVAHIPRIEDWPVMPTESTGFTLKPVNFFDENPALDVPSVAF